MCVEICVESVPRIQMIYKQAFCITSDLKGGRLTEDRHSARKPQTRVQPLDGDKDVTLWRGRFLQTPPLCSVLLTSLWNFLLHS